MTQSGQKHPANRGAGLAFFPRTPACHDLDMLDADIAAMGASTDEGSPFAPGSWFGSWSIREHSTLRQFGSIRP